MFLSFSLLKGFCFVQSLLLLNVLHLASVFSFCFFSYQSTNSAPSQENKLPLLGSTSSYFFYLSKTRQSWRTSSKIQSVSCCRCPRTNNAVQEEPPPLCPPLQEDVLHVQQVAGDRLSLVVPNRSGSHGEDTKQLAGIS